MSNKRKSKHIEPSAQKSPVVADPGANLPPSDIPVRCSCTRMEDVAALVPNPRNPNKHDERQLAMLAKIIRHQGWRAPIVVSKRSGFVVVGHGRLAAAKILKAEKVPVDYQEFATEADEWAHLIADNRIAELAEIDEKELAAILSELKSQDMDLDLTGFDADGLAGIGDLLADQTDVDAEPQIDKAAELQAKWKTEHGQVWQLGEHRLMCGGSDVSDDVGKLLLDDAPSMIWTDPPYGVSYEAKCKQLENYRPQNRASSFVANDSMTPEQTEALITSTLTIACAKVAPGCVLYVAAPAGPLHALFQSAITNSGFSWHHTLVWVKNHFVMGRSDYHYRHEPILYGWKENGPHYWGGDRNKDTVFQVDKPHDSDMHPTMKPVELVVQMVQNSSKRGGIVYEPFSGSGTTIIACEQLGRKCRAMEISPAYVAVAIQRWADATGKEPKLIHE